jgi:chromosome partitioning protein
VFRRFKGLNPEMGFAENLGVVINMRDMQVPVEGDYQKWLGDNPDNRLFTQTIPRASALQHASQLSPVERSYMAKYPGESGTAIRALSQELLSRLAAANASAPDKAVQPPPAAPAHEAPAVESEAT